MAISGSFSETQSDTSQPSTFNSSFVNRKFYFSKFPISDRTIKIVKNIMEIERTENYILSGKTGLSSIEEKYNGWFVGYVETKSNVYFFATNVIPTDGLNVDDFISSRINVTKNALKQMNIMK